MSNDSNTKQSKPTLQKATYSLILGIISVMLTFILIWHGDKFGVYLTGAIVAVICAVVGLTFGIKGLESTRRKFAVVLAIAGIAVCAIGTLFGLWWLIYWLLTGG